MSVKKPLVLDNGRIRQLKPSDELQLGQDFEYLQQLFRQLLVSCALQGVEPLFDELRAELDIAMKLEE